MWPRSREKGGFWRYENWSGAGLEGSVHSDGAGTLRCRQNAWAPTSSADLSVSFTSRYDVLYISLTRRTLRVYKNLYKSDKAQFKVGTQAFNSQSQQFRGAAERCVFVKPGSDQQDVVAPTSPYGSFGSPGAGRVMVVTGKLTF